MAALAILLGWPVIALYAASMALPFSPAELPYRQELKTHLWAPQGWSFFTRDPREPRLLPYVKTERGWRYAMLGPHSEPSNTFGFNRASRAQGVEMGLLSESITKQKFDWASCEEELITCFDRASVAGTIDNTSPSPTLCGEVGLAQQEPMPWAWSRNRHKISMPSKILTVQIKC